MTTEIFAADVQYNDYTGTVTADNSNINTIGNKLRKEGLIKEKEFVIGVRFYPSKLYSNQGKEISIDYYILDSFQFEDFQNSVRNGDKPVTRKVNQHLTFREFFDLFKRFDAVFSWKGLINDLEIEVNQDN